MIDAPCAVCGSHAATDVWRVRHDEYLEAIGIAPDAARKVLCLQCGLVYSRPQLEPAELRRLYATFRTSEMPSGPHLAAKQRLAREDFDWFRSHVSATGDVLEVGSAEGSFLALLARAGWHAVGVEPSAFAGFGRETYGLDIRRGLFEEMSFPDAAFDLVVALRVVEHVSDPRMFLRRVAAILRPGGLLYLEVPSAWKPRHRLAEFLGAQHLRLFTAPSLRALLATEGVNPVVLDDRGRGLRVLARRAAAADTPGAEPVPAYPAPPGRWALRFVFVRHHVKYLWKTRGRVALVAAVRCLPGFGRLNAWRKATHAAHDQ